ncbi:hypothetical protein [Paenibacillus segetis]|uniref:Mannosyltransferase related to Gpi18 n=1 Tax=Paenibacillus segetis TaxID=1325360 RepID=A0ABQ1YNU3_9BACL|nr:hypothetical protein [Paenibacillus segetis]GGH31242.1 hypothetical protein GCM10008013_34860 [Paenibacillus segetis]
MKKHDKILSIIFLLIMIVVAVFWVISTNTWTKMGTISAIVCFVLFVLLVLRSIPTLTAYILSNKPDEVMNRNRVGNRKQAWFYIIVWVLVSRILLLIIAYAMLIIKNGYSGGLFEKLMETWHISGIDAASYLGIAENGYVTTGDAKYHIVFFPFFPDLIRVAWYFTQNYLAAGFIVSNVCALVAALFAYELAMLDMRQRDAMRVVKYIFIFPAAFFFLIPMTESLFLALSLMCIYFVRQKQWLLGCFCGALAAYTRSPGILLAVPIAIEFTRDLVQSYRLIDKRAWALKFISAVACLAIIPLGLLTYFYINYSVTGNPFQFSIYQKEHWSQDFYLFFDTARYQMEYAVNKFLAGESSSFLGLWLPNLICIFSVLIIMLKGAKQLRPSYTAYFIVYFAFVVGATWLMSAPRYFSVAFPLAFATVLLTKDKSKDVAFTILSIVGSVLYLAVFVIGYPVY